MPLNQTAGEVAVARRAPPAWRSGAAGPAATVAATLMLLLAWETLCRWFDIHAVILPAPSDVGRAFAAHAGELAVNTLHTAAEATSAFLLSGLLGVAAASALTLSPLLKEALYPYLVALQTVPKIALAPLLTVWLSIGFTSRLAVAVFVSVFSVIVPLLAGLRATPELALRMARSAGASRWQEFVHIRFPYAVAYLFSGLKIAATTVVIGVVVGEFISSDRGLGHLILVSAARMETPIVMAAIAMLCVVGLAIYGAVAWAESALRCRMG